MQPLPQLPPACARSWPAGSSRGQLGTFRTDHRIDQRTNSVPLLHTSPRSRSCGAREVQRDLLALPVDTTVVTHPYAGAGSRPTSTFILVSSLCPTSPARSGSTHPHGWINAAASPRSPTVRRRQRNPSRASSYSNGGTSSAAVLDCAIMPPPSRHTFGAPPSAWSSKHLHQARSAPLIGNVRQRGACPTSAPHLGSFCPYTFRFHTPQRSPCFRFW